jgi:hypothetical protein
MKSKTIITRIIGLFAITLLVASCATPEGMETIEATEATTVKRGAVQGTVRSVEGVMDELSCYCGNGAYITDAEGVSTAVCFADDVYLAGCVEIEVSGDYETKTLESSDGPCPSGEMTFLRVKAYTCKASNR